MKSWVIENTFTLYKNCIFFKQNINLILAKCNKHKTFPIHHKRNKVKWPPGFDMNHFSNYDKLLPENVKAKITSLNFC